MSQLPNTRSIDRLMNLLRTLKDLKLEFENGDLKEATKNKIKVILKDQPAELAIIMIRKDGFTISGFKEMEVQNDR